MNSESKNKIFDVVLTEALKERLDTEFAKDDNPEQSDTYEFSDEFKKNVRKIARSIDRTDRIKLFAKVAFKTVASAAAVFGILFCVLLTQPEVYAGVQSVIRQVFDNHDRYEFHGDTPEAAAFDNTIRLGYVPDGYYLCMGNYNTVHISLTYMNNADEIRFEYGFAEGTDMYIENEHSEYEQFSSDGIEYYYYESTDESFTDKIVWENDGYAFVITGRLPKDELIKIAENVGK